jgi:hypothetical protein
VVWETISIVAGLVSIAFAVYFGVRGLGSKIDLLSSNLSSKFDLLIEKVDSIREDTSTIRDKVVAIDERTRPLTTFKQVVEKV